MHGRGPIGGYVNKIELCVKKKQQEHMLGSTARSPEKNRTTHAKAEYSLLREEEEDKSEESNEHLVVRFFVR